MENKPRMISGTQLVFLLLISRLFTLFTFVPRARTAASGSTALLCIPLAGAAVGILLIPFLLLLRRSQTDLLSCAFQLGSGYGLVVSLLFGVFCIYMAAFTTSHFSFFMASAVYPNSTPWAFLLLLTLAAGYAASLGLEAFSRMSVWVFSLLLLLLLLFVCALLPEVNPVYLTSPLLDGLPAVGKGIFYTAVNHAEAVALILLLPRVRRAGGRVAAGWLVLTILVYELLSFLTLTVLGDYAKTRLFPLHTLSSLAQLSGFGRLDLLHIALWIFAAFLRLTVYLYCAAVCLRRIFPSAAFGRSCACCAAVSGIWSLATARGMQFWNRISEQVWVVAAPFLLLVAAVPLVTLLLTSLGRNSAGKGRIK